MHLSIPRRRAGWIICFFKNLDRKRLSLSLGPKRAWRVMDESTLDHTHPPSRQQAAVGSSRASSKATHAPSTKLWKQVNVHRTLRPLLGPPRARSLHSCIHLAALPRLHRWSQWSRLYSVWVPGAAQPSRWLLRTI